MRADIETHADGSVAAEFDRMKIRVRDAVEVALGDGFRRYSNTPVRQVAEYITCGGGHRWRAIAATAAGMIFRPDALDVGLPGACGVELAHAASMILDDLPSMDNARFRRGKPCAHLVFPGWAVDMAPVFMVTMAYELSLENPRATAAQRVEAALYLSRAGHEMIAGQSSDVFGNSSDEGALLIRYRQKTGSLYAAAMAAGGVLCGADTDEAKSLYSAGVNLGLGYQYLDDVADVVAALAEVGKEPGRDAGKLTAISLLGVDGARRKAAAFKEAALADLDRFGARAALLRALVNRASAD